MKLNRSCLTCGNEFRYISTQPNQKFCSLSCSNHQRKLKSIEKYNQNPRRCLECNEALNYDNRKGKFCTKSCAAQYNNARRSPMSDEQRNKIRQSLLIRNLSRPKKPKITHSLICVVCHSSFNYRKIRKTCSKSCNSKLNELNGRKSASVRCLRSKDEIRLFNLCEQAFDNVTHNEVLINGWDADIVIRDHMIAILWNGPWHYQQMPVAKHSLAQVQNRDKIKIDLLKKSGWNILVFEDRHYSPESAFEEVKRVAEVGIDPTLGYPSRI